MAWNLLQCFSEGRNITSFFINEIKFRDHF